MTNSDHNRVYDAQGSDRQQQYVALVEQLDLTLRARIPLLYVIAVEEEPVEEVLLQVAKRSRSFRRWYAGSCRQMGVTSCQIL